MPGSDGENASVYQTRLVDNGTGEVWGRNLFASPETARHYLEKYVQIRWGAEPTDWREEQSPRLSKWSMYPEGMNARAVVAEREVHESAEERLDGLHEVQEQLLTDGGQPAEEESAAIERTPSKVEQALEAARDDPTRRELTNMVYDLLNVVEVMVDGEHENFRPTVITIGFDDSGYRATPAVLDIMRAAGWKAQDVVFSPYNRVSFVEADADE